MPENKTQQNSEDVQKFIQTVEDEQKRKDCLEVAEIMTDITRTQPAMWGSSIVGFGRYHYRYDSGREGDFFYCGFSPRKQNLTLYIVSGFADQPELMEKLGKYKTGKSCLYLKRLEDVHLPTLRKLIQRSVKHLKKKWAKGA